MGIDSSEGERPCEVLGAASAGRLLGNEVGCTPAMYERIEVAAEKDPTRLASE